MFSKSTEVSQNSIQIKEDDKFFSRRLSKETSMANPSSRVYYGGVAGAVPFLWESQPGTPKCKIFSETTLPPLTPPPSYYSNSNVDKKPAKKSRSISLLHILFPKMNVKKTNNASSNSSSFLSVSSWSSSSTFAMVVPITSPLKKYRLARSRFSSRGSSFDSRTEDEEPGFASPASTLRFKLRGCYGILR
ncbi:uncharacterized protein LOC123224027 [Mangifera indica]|uniref:uncharacterized protein LOC123224027 n=1 Tax=Mangifera indica TaxID=29780 RepID=UPI001CFB9FAA|nr:uncharacterized protein LOC123224027 [Mangifera indica]